MHITKICFTEILLSWRNLMGLVLLLSLSSCGTLRQSQSPRPGWGPEGHAPYARRLNMPLTGQENPDLIKTAARWLGTPHRLGGSTPAGADCSGFVWAVYRDVYGESIPRTTREMASESRRVRQGRLQEGDLVFFRTKGWRISHVGIYLGNGHFVHASTSRGVIVNELNEDYYRRNFARGGRFR